MAMMTPGIMVPNLSGPTQKKLVTYDLDVDEENAETSVQFNPNNDLPLNVQKSKLPLSKRRLDFLYCVENNDFVLVFGSAGCGKSTQLPQYFLEAGYCKQGKVAITVSKRLAVIQLAERVADEVRKAAEFEDDLGPQRQETNSENPDHYNPDVVGYSIKNLVRTTENTKIVYMTDDILLKEMMSDPLLFSYSTIIIDDIHTRTVTQDLLFGLLVKIKASGYRRDLRIVLTSASMDVKVYVEYIKAVNRNLMQASIQNAEGLLQGEPDAKRQKLDGEPDCAANPGGSEVVDGEVSKLKYAILTCEGKCFPVRIKYLKVPCANYVEEAVSICVDILKNRSVNRTAAGKVDYSFGDILIFLTGHEEIADCVEFLQSHLDQEIREGALRIHPLHAGMSFLQQVKAFQGRPEGVSVQKSPFRKVIVATNLAESSVTIPGVRFVIDSCFVKTTCYDGNVQYKNVVKCSKTSCDQRAGRAGRLDMGGVCYRLTTKEEYEKSENEAGTTTLTRGLFQYSIPQILTVDFANTALQLKTLGIDRILEGFAFPTPPMMTQISEGLEKLHALRIVDSSSRLTQPLGLLTAQTYCVIEDVNLIKLLYVAIEMEIYGVVAASDKLLDEKGELFVNKTNPFAEQVKNATDGKDAQGFVKTLEDNKSAHRIAPIEATKDETVKLKRQRGIAIDELFTHLVAAVESKDTLLHQVISIISMLSVQSPFLENTRNKDRLQLSKQCFVCEEGDLVSLLNVYRQWIEEERLEIMDDQLRQKQSKAARKNAKPSNRAYGWCKKLMINKSCLERAREIQESIMDFVSDKVLPSLFKTLDNRTRNIIFSNKIQNLQREIAFKEIQCEFGFSLPLTEELDVEDLPTRLRRCICAAYFLNTCRKLSTGKYELIKGTKRRQIFEIGYSSFLYDKHQPLSGPNMMCFVRVGAQGNELLMEGLTPIDPKWLQQLGGNVFL